MIVKQDEAHRFLKWQRTLKDCAAWSTWLRRQSIEHTIGRTSNGWTIYKHGIGKYGERCCPDDY